LFLSAGIVGLHICLLSQVYLRFKHLAFLGKDQNQNRGSSVNFPTDNGKAEEGPKDDIELQQKPRKLPMVLREETNSKTAAISSFRAPGPSALNSRIDQNDPALL
jgi:hypothetical protein